MNPLEVVLGKSKSYKLPKIKDIDNDKFTLTIIYEGDGGPSLPTFIGFNTLSSEFTVSPNDEKYVGSHLMSLIL